MTFPMVIAISFLCVIVNFAQVVSNDFCTEKTDVAQHTGLNLQNDSCAGVPLWTSEKVNVHFQNCVDAQRARILFTIFGSAQKHASLRSMASAAWIAARMLKAELHIGFIKDEDFLTSSLYHFSLNYDTWIVSPSRTENWDVISATTNKHRLFSLLPSMSLPTNKHRLSIGARTSLIAESVCSLFNSLEISILTTPQQGNFTCRGFDIETIHCIEDDFEIPSFQSVFIFDEACSDFLDKNERWEDIEDREIGVWEVTDSYLEKMDDSASPRISFIVTAQPFLMGFLAATSAIHAATIDNVVVPQELSNFPEVATGPKIITDYDEAYSLWCRTFGLRFCEFEGIDEDLPDIYFKDLPADANCPCIQRSTLIHYIHHGIAETDAFWQNVETGIREAERTLGLEVVIKSPFTLDSDEQEILLRQSIECDENVFGIVSSAQTETIAYRLREASEKDIKTYIVNAGSEYISTSNAKAYIGQQERRGGYLSARLILQNITEEAKATTTLLCVDHEWGTNPGINARCNGMRDYLEENGFPVSEDNFHINVPAQNTLVQVELISEAYEKTLNEESIQTVAGFISGGDGACIGAKTFLDDESFVGDKISLMCYDTSQVVLEYLKNGEADFLISQQPWLQGYLPVLLLGVQFWTGEAPLCFNSSLITGPSFVQKDDNLDFKSCESYTTDDGDFVGWNFCGETIIQEVWLNIPGGAHAAISALNAVLLFITIICHVSYWNHRSDLIVKTASHRFMQIILISQILLFISSQMQMIDFKDKSIATCLSYFGFGTFGVTGIFFAFSLKNLRLLQIFRIMEEGTLDDYVITDNVLLIIWLSLQFATLVFITIKSLVDDNEPESYFPYSPRIEYNSDQNIYTETHEKQFTCNITSIPSIAVYFWIFSSALFCIITAYKTSHLPHLYNESSSMSLIVLIFFACAVSSSFVAFGYDNLSSRNAFNSSAISFFVFVVLLMYHLPRVVIVLRGQGDDALMTISGKKRLKFNVGGASSETEESTLKIRTTGDSSMDVVKRGSTNETERKIKKQRIQNLKDDIDNITHQNFTRRLTKFTDLSPSMSIRTEVELTETRSGSQNEGRVKTTSAKSTPPTPINTPNISKRQPSTSFPADLKEKWSQDLTPDMMDVLAFQITDSMISAADTVGETPRGSITNL